MNRFMAVAAVFLLFLSGIAAGILGTHLYYSRQLQRPGAIPGMRARTVSARLESRLDLSPEQKEEIEGILETTRAEAAALHSDLRPRVHSLIDGAAGEIEKVLDPEQLREFRRIRRDHRRWINTFILGPPHGHRPPHGRGLGRGRGQGFRDHRRMSGRQDRPPGEGAPPRWDEPPPDAPPGPWDEPPPDAPSPDEQPPPPEEP